MKECENCFCRYAAQPILFTYFFLPEEAVEPPRSEAAVAARRASLGQYLGATPEVGAHKAA